MTVYAVYDWDSMASNHGREYLHSVYVSKEQADAIALGLNTRAREWWMKNCSPEGRANYRDQAYVQSIEVHE